MMDCSRLAAATLVIAAGVQPASAFVPDPPLPALAIPAALPDILPQPLPDAVRAMIDAAIASGERKDVETVVALAKATNPRSIGEIDAILSAWQAQHDGEPETDPVRQMLAAAIASKKDGDVEAVGKIAKETSPEQVAEIDALLVDYRAKRAAEKRAAADAARAKLAAAKFWENWKGEGQIGASQSSGNTDALGINLGIALTRKGIDWKHRVMAQADYQRTNGLTTAKRFIGEYEPQVRISDRAFAFGLGRWERDRMLGFDTRVNASGGLGYTVIQNKKMTLSVKAGPAWRRTEFITGFDDSEISGLAGLDFGWQLSPTLKLTQTASTIVGETTTSTSSLTALNAKLTGGLSARLAYSAALDTHPPVGIEHLDTTTRFTLVYGF